MAGNSAYYKDFREHLNALEKRGKLVRISRDINKDTELMPLVRWQFRGGHFGRDHRNLRHRLDVRAGPDP